MLVILGHKLNIIYRESIFAKAKIGSFLNILQKRYKYNKIITKMFTEMKSYAIVYSRKKINNLFDLFINNQKGANM